MSARLINWWGFFRLTAYPTDDFRLRFFSPSKGAKKTWTAIANQGQPTQGQASNTVKVLPLQADVKFMQFLFI